MKATPNFVRECVLSWSSCFHQCAAECSLSPPPPTSHCRSARPHSHSQFPSDDIVRAHTKFEDSVRVRVRFDWCVCVFVLYKIKSCTSGVCVCVWPVFSPGTVSSSLPSPHTEHRQLHAEHFPIFCQSFTECGPIVLSVRRANSLLQFYRIRKEKKGREKLKEYP